MALAQPDGDRHDHGDHGDPQGADEEGAEVVDALAGEPAVREEDRRPVDLGDEGPRLLGERPDDAGADEDGDVAAAVRTHLTIALGADPAGIATEVVEGAARAVGAETSDIGGPRRWRGRNGA